MTKFDNEIYKVKGLWAQDDEIVIKGFYCEDEHGRMFIVDEEEFKYYEVNPYTLCKNSLLKSKDGEFLYEYDVVACQSPFNDKVEYAYIEFNEIYQCYVLVAGIEQRSVREIKKATHIKRTGKNIILSDDDYEWFKKYELEEYEKSKGKAIDNSYCPSRFKK